MKWITLCDSPAKAGDPESSSGIFEGRTEALFFCTDYLINAAAADYDHHCEVAWTSVVPGYLTMGKPIPRYPGLVNPGYLGMMILRRRGILFSACYSIWLYNRISYGSHSPYLAVTNDVNRREFMVLITLMIPTVLFGIFPNIILDSLHVSVTTLLYNIPL